MYINFDLLNKNDIKSGDLFILQIIKQKEYERLEGLNVRLNKLYKAGFIQVIKGTKDQPTHEKARLSKKGSAFLKAVDIPGITKESKQLAADLLDLFNEDGGPKSNKAKIEKLVAWYLGVTGFDSDLVLSVVADNKAKWRLDNMIHKAPNIYSTNLSLDNSYLYTLMTNEK